MSRHNSRKEKDKRKALNKQRDKEIKEKYNPNILKTGGKPLKITGSIQDFMKKQRHNNDPYNKNK